MKASHRRIICSLPVLFWSGVMLYFYTSGRLNAYLAPDFRLFVFLGGLGLGVLGLFTLLTTSEEAGCSHDHEEGDMHPWVVLAVMSVPVLLAMSWTKDEYSPATLARKGLHEAPGSSNSPIFAASMPPLTREMIEQGHGRTDDGFYQFSLMELFLATGDRELQAAIDGMKVETIGRWADEKGGGTANTRKRLYRLFMTCCVADSRAIPIVLEFAKTPLSFEENAWVKVTGTMRFPLENGMLQPVLEVEHAETTDAPSEESFMRK